MTENDSDFPSVPLLKVGLRKANFDWAILKLHTLNYHTVYVVKCFPFQLSGASKECTFCMGAWMVPFCRNLIRHGGQSILIWIKRWRLSQSSCAPLRRMNFSEEFAIGTWRELEFEMSPEQGKFMFPVFRQLGTQSCKAKG